MRDHIGTCTVHTNQVNLKEFNMRALTTMSVVVSRIQ